MSYSTFLSQPRKSEGWKVGAETEPTLRPEQEVDLLFIRLASLLPTSIDMFKALLPWRWASLSRKALGDVGSAPPGVLVGRGPTYLTGRPFSDSNHKTTANDEPPRLSASALSPETVSNETSITNGSSGGESKGLNKILEEITGVHEISALKEAVRQASEELHAATQRLQDLRQRLDQQTANFQELSATYNEMMVRRHEWSDEDVKTFAQLTSDEGRARSAVDTGRLELKAAEDYWQTAQTTYMDTVRQRYHEEQVWHDKWRVLGTYWTWTLIGLNSVVFIGGQVLHYRRETDRLNALHDMIRPLTEFNHPTVTESKDTVKSTPTSTGPGPEVEDEESPTKTADSQHEVWKAHLQNWAEISLHLWQQTLLLGLGGAPRGDATSTGPPATAGPTNRQLSRAIGYLQ